MGIIHNQCNYHENMDNVFIFNGLENEQLLQLIYAEHVYQARENASS